MMIRSLHKNEIMGFPVRIITLDDDDDDDDDDEYIELVQIINKKISPISG